MRRWFDALVMRVSDMGEREALLQGQPDAFFTTPHYDGYPAVLIRLEAVDPRAAEVVMLRFFSGMSNPEVAEHLGLSVRTVEGDWTHARAWLKRELSGQQ